MPILAPLLSPELVPPVLPASVGDDELLFPVLVWLCGLVLDDPLLELALLDELPELDPDAEDADAEDADPEALEAGVDAAVLEGELEVGLSLGLLLVEAGVDAGALVSAGKEEEGLWPSRYLMLSPTLCGSEATFARTVASLKATVVFDASVQEQYDPG